MRAGQLCAKWLQDQLTHQAIWSQHSLLCRQAYLQVGYGQQQTGSQYRHNSTMSTPHTSFYDSTVERYAAQPTEVLSLYQMLNFGRNAAYDSERILKSGRFVQREIPKRLARRLLDLQLLPYIVVTNPHIKKVYDSYYTSFNLLRQLPPIQTLEDNATFSEMLRKQLDQHAPMLDALATGLREVKSKQLVGRCLQLDAFFDSMLRSRISRRVIAEQHLRLPERRPGFVGIIEIDLEVADAVDCAAQKTRQVCMETYGLAPEIIVSGDVSARVPYIPPHLDYMLFELLKNAARAVVEHHMLLRHSHHHHHTAAQSLGQQYQQSWGNKNTTRGLLPPVHVRICAGFDSPDLTIKISDQGGGIPQHMQERVWSYGFTTVDGIPEGFDVPTPQPHQQPSTGANTFAIASPFDAIPQAQMLHGGALPSGYAAAASHQSHWHEYSPAPAGSGPYAPQRITSPNPTPHHTTRKDPSGQQPGHLTVEKTAGMGLMDTMGEGAAGQGGASGRFRMAGLGFGLPLSRLYARFFGGDLTLQVVPGYGTDAYLQIKRLEGRDWKEEVDEPLVHSGVVNE